jgi:hypothetical protein
LGNGRGGFQAGHDVPTDGGPNDVVMADFNGDGRQDFVTANFAADSISLGIGDGNGGFQASSLLDVGDGSCLMQVCSISRSAKPAFSASSIIQPTTYRLKMSSYVELHITRLMWSTWLCGVAALKPKRPLESGVSDST